MARLVKCSCPSCGAGLRIDPDQEVVTCQFCKTSSFVETDERHPPAQPRPDVAYQTVIHVPAQSRRSSGAAGCIFFFAFVPLIIGGLVAAWQLGAIELPFDVPFLQTADYFEDATELPGVFEAGIGKGYRTRQLLLYPAYAVIEARPPGDRDVIDRYTARGGGLGERDPQRLTASDKENLQDFLFDLSDVDLSRVPVMIADAKERLGYEGGEATHLMLQRWLTFHTDVRWYVYISGPRDSGYVTYSLAGEPIDTVE